MPAVMPGSLSHQRAAKRMPAARSQDGGAADGSFIVRCSLFIGRIGGQGLRRAGFLKFVMARSARRARRSNPGRWIATSGGAGLAMTEKLRGDGPSPGLTPGAKPLPLTLHVEACLQTQKPDAARARAGRDGVHHAPGAFQRLAPAVQPDEE